MSFCALGEQTARKPQASATCSHPKPKFPSLAQAPSVPQRGPSDPEPGHRQPHGQIAATDRSPAAELQPVLPYSHVSSGSSPSCRWCLVEQFSLQRGPQRGDWCRMSSPQSSVPRAPVRRLPATCLRPTQTSRRYSYSDRSRRQSRSTVPLPGSLAATCAYRGLGATYRLVQTEPSHSHVSSCSRPAALPP